MLIYFRISFINLMHIKYNDQDIKQGGQQTNNSFIISRAVRFSIDHSDTDSLGQ